MARDRAIWITRRQPFMRNHLERLIFIDETSLKTNMTKAAGWAQVGDRLIDHAPAGRWNTQTFIAGLRHDRIDATGVINGAMDREMFELYVCPSSEFFGKRERFHNGGSGSVSV